MLNRKKSPKIIDAVELNLQLKPFTKFTLDNGVEVYSIHAGAQEVVMVEMVFFAGNWYEEKNVVAASTNFMLKNGTKQKKAFTINEHFEFHGAYLNRGCHNETATMTLHTLGKHIPKLLPVMAELLTDSIFPEDELAIYKQNQKQRLSINLKKCDFVANRLIDEYLFGYNHPYGKYSSAEHYDNINTEDLKAFYQQFYTNGKCIIFVAGILPADIQEQINSAFGHLPFNTKPLPTIDYKAMPFVEKKHQISNDVNGVQAAIRIARPFPSRHHPDFSKVQVLNNLFGGFFGSRLMSNIREDKGYTYGIQSYLQNLIQQSAWMISTEAGRDVSAATISEVYKEMARIKTEPIPDDEINLVRNYMMGSLLNDLDGPFQIISRWKSYVLNGLDESYFNRAIHTIRTVTSEELQEMANKYMIEEEFYELVVI